MPFCRAFSFGYRLRTLGAKIRTTTDTIVMRNDGLKMPEAVGIASVFENCSKYLSAIGRQAQ
jgi:hypothetical protein